MPVLAIYYQRQSVTDKIGSPKQSNIKTIIAPEPDKMQKSLTRHFYGAHQIQFSLHEDTTILCEATYKTILYDLAFFFITMHGVLQL